MRRIVGVVLAALAGLGFYLFAWPQLGPYVIEYIPRPGDNRIAINQVAPGANGTWDISVTYYYNNRPSGGRISVKLAGTPNGKEYPLVGGYSPVAFPGERTVRIRAERPFSQEAISATKVVVDIRAPGKQVPIVSASQEAKIAWADWETYTIGREVFDHPPEQVVTRAAELAAKGDIDSVLRAKAVLQALLARYPQHAGASAELVRLQADSGWSESGVRKLNTYSQLRTLVWALEQRKSYEELDAMQEALARSQALDADGYPLLTMYYAALNHMLRQDGATTARQAAGYEANYRGWLAKRPQSVAARLALANMYVTLARNVKGQRSSLPDADSLLRTYGEKGFEALRSCDGALCQENPEWHRNVMDLLCTMDAPRETFGAAFVQAYAQAPGYLPIHKSAACYIGARSKRDLLDFARQLGDKAPKDIGDGVYMHALTDAIGGYGPSFGHVTAAEFGVDCRRLVHGHEQWLAKYPSQENWNRAAAAAGQCDDKAAARRFLEHITEPKLDAWGSETDGASREFARVKQWAS
jgi:hypothetical protein